MTEQRSPFGRRPRIGVDVSGALNLVGSLIKYLGASCLVPAIFAVAHTEPAWPFVTAGALVSGFGLTLERLTHGAEEVGVREGYLIISVTWLVVAAYGALPYVLAGDPQLGRPVDALDHLRRAIELDPKWAKAARNDTDFDSIRREPGFPA